MEQTALVIAIEVFVVLATGMGGYALYRLKQMEADIREARDKARAAPDEDKVRKIVSEESQSVKRAVEDIKDDMNQMASNLLKTITNLENRFNDLLMHMINKRD